MASYYATHLRFIAFVALIVLLTTGFVGVAQQPASGSDNDRDHGVELYKQGDAPGAVASLQGVVKHSKDDIIAWHYLGLALAQIGKKNEARKAHEKAAKAADKLVTSFLDQMSPLPKAQVLAGADSADQYLALSLTPSKKTREEWEDRAAFLRSFAADSALNLLPIYTAKDVTTKARILSKPEPQYTEQARQNQVTGRVVLRAVFAADARIRAIQVVSGLPDGLTRKAIMAAQRIKFVPATKDGKPVSMFFQLEYNFNLY